MRKRIVVSFIAIAIAIAVVAAFAAAAYAALPRVGSPAPDFVLKSASGHNIRLSELRGQVVLINFWASWCGPCREELPLLARLHQRYRGAGFALLAVNIDDDRGNADTLLRKLGVNLAPLYDGDKRVAKRYDVDTMPATLIVDRDGRVRYVHRGFHSGYEAKYEREVRELLTQ
jgi:peroxiredoxin